MYKYPYLLTYLLTSLHSALLQCVKCLFSHAISNRNGFSPALSDDRLYRLQFRRRRTGGREGHASALRPPLLKDQLADRRGSHVDASAGLRLTGSRLPPRRLSSAVGTHWRLLLIENGNHSVPVRTILTHFSPFIPRPGGRGGGNRPLETLNF